jgi:hypothetical protein
MDNFDLKKYLTKGQLYENNNYKNIKGLQLEENEADLVDGGYLLPIYFKDHDVNPGSWKILRILLKRLFILPSHSL